MTNFRFYDPLQGAHPNDILTPPEDEEEGNFRRNVMMNLFRPIASKLNSTDAMSLAAINEDMSNSISPSDYAHILKRKNISWSDIDSFGLHVVEKLSLWPIDMRYADLSGRNPRHLLFRDFDLMPGFELVYFIYRDNMRFGPGVDGPSFTVNGKEHYPIAKVDVLRSDRPTSRPHTLWLFLEHELGKFEIMNSPSGIDAVRGDDLFFLMLTLLGIGRHCVFKRHIGGGRTEKVQGRQLHTNEHPFSVKVFSRGAGPEKLENYASDNPFPVGPFPYKPRKEQLRQRALRDAAARMRSSVIRRSKKRRTGS